GSKVVAITGSAGRTTTKEIAAEFVAARYRVIRNRGNFNNQIGLPLSLIELRERPEIAVVELGMNHAGEISTLVRIAEPDVRVWTNVGEAHLGFFASVEAIADAKAEIFEGATRAAVLVANADDERIAERPPGHRGECVRLSVGGRVIDDGYNANPDATRGALDVLAGAAGVSRRVAVLGEMLELGERAEALHQDVGRAAARAGVDVLVAVGGAPAGARAGAGVAAGLAAHRGRRRAPRDGAGG